MSLNISPLVSSPIILFLYLYFLPPVLNHFLLFCILYDTYKKWNYFNTLEVRGLIAREQLKGDENRERTDFL